MPLITIPATAVFGYGSPIEIIADHERIWIGTHVLLMFFKVPNIEL
jgi:hypothetical protein